mgnify:CR=1 FL=1
MGKSRRAKQSVGFGAGVLRKDARAQGFRQITDELDNVAKFFGDYYLARIYMGLASRLHLNDYHATVDQKLATLNDLYRSVVDYLDARQNLFLEWAIVLLIVFEIVMAFVRH